MLIIPIMVFISWQTGNNLWAYLALGMSVLGTLSRAASQSASKQKPTTNAVNDLIKALKANQN